MAESLSSSNSPTPPETHTIKAPEVEAPKVVEVKPVVQQPVKPNPPVVQQPYKFDEARFKDKVVVLTKLIQEYSGRENYNPHLWFGKTVSPLTNQYKNGNRTKELFDSLMSIKEVIPPINPDATKK